MEEFIKQFLTKDCRDIKVDEIAENLGISKRTIYENFDSKNEIVRQTLQNYQQMSQIKILELCNAETNPLKKILQISFVMLEYAREISIARLIGLRKHYPEIAEDLITIHVQFMRENILKLYTKAQEEGYIFMEVEFEFLLALLLGGEKNPNQKIMHFMGKEFEVLRLLTAHFFTIIRGVSTMKGVKVCDAYYKEYLQEKIFTK